MRVRRSQQQTNQNPQPRRSVARTAVHLSNPCHDSSYAACIEDVLIRNPGSMCHDITQLRGASAICSNQLDGKNSATYMLSMCANQPALNRACCALQLSTMCQVLEQTIQTLFCLQKNAHLHTTVDALHLLQNLQPQT
jgi:hypothetical protein